MGLIEAFKQLPKQGERIYFPLSLSVVAGYYGTDDGKPNLFWGSSLYLKILGMEKSFMLWSSHQSVRLTSNKAAPTRKEQPEQIVREKEEQKRLPLSAPFVICSLLSATATLLL